MTAQTNPMGDYDVDGPDYLQTLSRGLSVIRAFGADAPRMTLAQVAQRTDLSRAVVRRCLRTLIHDGYALTDGKVFWLSPRILELGFAYLSSTHFLEVARPLMDDVARRTREICALSVLDGADVVFLHTARVPSKRIVTLNIVAGSRLPAYASSMGRMLLASLSSGALDYFFKSASLRRLTERTVVNARKLRQAIDQARKDGWCLVDGEIEGGLRSIAVPVTDRLSRTTAALNIVCHSSQVTNRQMVDRFLPVLRQVAARISGQEVSASARKLR